MEAKLLTDLDERIRNSADRVAWARDVCRKASYFARQGQTRSALAAIDKVRKEFGTRLDSEVACWLMLAEGILFFFQMKLSEAYDLVRGAYGMAIAFDAKRARPTCAAWMAHIEFNEYRFESMIRFLEETLSTAAADDHQALGRASLDLADAFQFAGRYAKARPWYERTRQHATAEGDRSMLSALFYNVAAFRVANVRLADAFGENLPEEVTRASMEISSAFNYDAAIGTSSLQSFFPLLQSQLLTVEQRYYEALVALAPFTEELVPKRLRSIVFVDRAWCSIGLGLLKEGREFTAEAARGIDDLEPDDLAYVLGRIAQVERKLGEKFIEDCEQRAHAALQQHRKTQLLLEGQLDRLQTYLS